MTRMASEVFEDAVAAAEHLELRSGLSAIKKGEGKGRIVKGDAPLLGSVAIDGNCRAAYPQSARWDYAIGVEVDGKAKALFIEVHGAETSGVSDLEKKLTWLLDFLQREPQEALRGLPREIHWVASGRINIPKHVPQYKRLTTTLRKRGLQGPVERLGLP